MPVSSEFLDFVKDQLSGLGTIVIRPMFGGAGVYCNGVMFALIADETLYFKADDKLIPDFQAEGMTPFTYDGKGKVIVMSYWRVPERLYDEAEEMTRWAQASLEVALRSTKSSRQLKSPRKRGSNKRYG